MPSGRDSCFSDEDEDDAGRLSTCSAWTFPGLTKTLPASLCFDWSVIFSLVGFDIRIEVEYRREGVEVGEVREVESRKVYSGVEERLDKATVD